MENDIGLLNRNGFVQAAVMPARTRKVRTRARIVENTTSSIPNVILAAMEFWRPRAMLRRAISSLEVRVR